MKILFLDGSPKAQNSASVHFLQALEQRLGQGHEIAWHNARTEDPLFTAADIMGSGALVIAFPLYVDGIPSHLLAFLEGLEKALAQYTPGTPVYALCNAGFYEARQTHLALDMMKLWCEKARLTWGQGIGIGAGGMAMAAPVGKGPFTKLGMAFDELAQRITQQGTARNLFIEPSFPRFLYKAMAHMSWRAQARTNGVAGRKMKKQWEYIR